MSHIARIKLEIKSLEALAEAVRTLGGEFRRGQTVYNTFRMHGGMTVEGFTDEDIGKCDHAIYFPGARYEMGVCARRDGKAGYVLMYDADMDPALNSIIGGKDGARLKQEYGAAVATRWYLQNGYRTTRTVVNGKIQLKAWR